MSRKASWDYTFSVVYYKSGRLSVTLHVHKRKPKTFVDTKRLQLDFLEAHNKYRRMHSVPDLVLDEELCQSAQEWADILAMTNGIHHRKRPPYGENIICTYSSNPNFEVPDVSIVDVWYEEISDHSFEEEPNTSKTVNFCQIVWKSTTKFGIAWAKSRQGYIYVVGHYNPAGNRMGQYTKNVFNVSNVPKPTKDIEREIITTPSNRIGLKVRAIEEGNSIGETKKKAHEIMEKINTVENIDTKDIPATIEESKQKAGDVVKHIERIKPDTVQIQNVSQVHNMKHKMQEVIQTLDAMEQYKSDKTDEAATDIIKEAKGKADNVMHAIEELETETQHFVRRAKMVEGAKQAAEEMVHTFGELNIDWETVENIPDILEPVKHKAKLMIQALEVIEEEIPVHNIPMVIDNVKHEAQDMINIIERMEADEDYANDMPTVIDEARQKTQEVVDFAITNGNAEKVMTLQEAEHKKHDIIQECLDAHNKYRKKHGVPPLKLNEELCKLCQEMIDGLLGEEPVEIKHRGVYNENVYYTETETIHDFNGYEAVDYWCSESAIYKFGEKPPPDYRGNHFTQIVWKDTTDLGVAYKKGNQWLLLVCYYNPRGNIKNQFTKNVFPKLGSSQSIIDNDFVCENIVDGYCDTLNTTNGIINIIGGIKEMGDPKSILQAVTRARDKSEGLVLSIEQMIADVEDIQKQLHVVNVQQDIEDIIEKLLPLHSEETNNLTTMVEKSLCDADDTLAALRELHQARTDIVDLLEVLNALKETANEVQHYFAKHTIDWENVGNIPNILKEPTLKTLEIKETIMAIEGMAKSIVDKLGLIEIITIKSQDLVASVKEVMKCAAEIIAQDEASETKNIPHASSVSRLTSHLEETWRTSRKTEMDETQEKRFALQCLAAHNKYREKHGAPPLKLNKAMSVACRNRAEELFRKNGGNSPDRLGENTCFFCDDNSRYAGYMPVDSWYSEGVSYEYGKEPEDEDAAGTIHFTQLIWSDTKEVGIGSFKKDDNVQVVCMYTPRGNVKNQYVSNVHPPVLEKKVPKSTKEVVESVDFLEESFKSDFLNTHNKYRRRHGVPPLILDETLSFHAQAWANELAKRDAVADPRSLYGTNMFSQPSGDPNYKLAGNIPVDSWYGQKGDYDFGHEPKSSRWNNFTQVIWKHTKSVGVGYAKSKSGTIYIVAHYNPAGNDDGKYTNNVCDIDETWTHATLEKGADIH